MATALQFCIEMDGVFDDRAALRIAEALACVQRGGALRIDVSRVRDFQDHAIALLARTLASGRAGIKIVINGLSLHQSRLLSYMGIDLEMLAAVPRRPGLAIERDEAEAGGR
jgi:hypothetical protein